MRRVWVSSAVAGGSGLLVAIILTVVQGLAYRDREEQGLEPAQAPTWVAQATYLGLAVFAVAVLVIATTVIARALRRGSGPA